MDFESFYTDHKAENEGVWVSIARDARIKIARASEANESYTSALRAKFRDHRHDLEQEDDVSAKLQEDILIELYAYHVLKDVEGIKLEGEEVKYTPEVGLKLLRNRDFFARVRQHATNFEHFRQKAEDKAVKN